MSTYRFVIGSKRRPHIRCNCGDGCPALVIASVGTSNPGDSHDLELRKAIAAQAAGADIVTDHSFYGDIPRYHETLVSHLDLAVSTVTCYEFGARYGVSGFADVPPRCALELVEKHAARGFDMLTVHASLLRPHLQLLDRTNRLIPMTSKGGSLIAQYMRATGENNPYYEQFDDVLRILHHYGVTLSLGTSFRPASICDRWDDLIQAELDTMAVLVHRAMLADVNVMVEGVGHATLDRIPEFVRSFKAKCNGAPYRVLAVATDIALGCDHIAGAIASAAAVAAGADAATCVSRAEHLGLPSIEDTKEAVIATRVAVHCGDLVRLGDVSRDRQMSSARWRNGCRGDCAFAICPENAREEVTRRLCSGASDPFCTMCGAYCGLSGARKLMAEENREGPSK